MYCQVGMRASVWNQSTIYKTFFLPNWVFLLDWDNDFTAFCINSDTAYILFLIQTAIIQFLRPIKLKNIAKSGQVMGVGWEEKWDITNWYQDSYNYSILSLKSCHFGTRGMKIMLFGREDGCWDEFQFHKFRVFVENVNYIFYFTKVTRGNFGQKYVFFGNALIWVKSKSEVFFFLNSRLRRFM